ncbi:MAG TPA: peptidylprolyl isomerase [Terriglobales bacterium]|nr:peptidylprolyl isomerase [Terriglobales bacterium]
MKRLLLLPLTLCLVAASAFAGDTVIEEIIARVNNQIITRSELQKNKEQMMNEVRQQFSGMEADKKIADDEKNLLRDAIDKQLLIEKGADLGITADTELIKYLDQIRKQMNLPDMESLEKAAQQQGISFEDFKQARKDDIITQQVISKEVGSRIQITHEEMQQFYDSHKAELEHPEQVRLSEILVSTEIKGAKEGESMQASPEQIAAAEKKANDIHEQLAKGAKFEDLAHQFSDGPTAGDGGDLQYFKRGTLSKDLEDRAFSMKAGDFTEPIRTKQGWVILKVTEHQQAGIPPLKEIEPRIQEAIYMKKLQPELRKYLTKLREEAYIDIKPGFIDTGASPNQTKPVFTTAADTNEKAKELKRKKKFGIF